MGKRRDPNVRKVRQALKPTVLQKAICGSSQAENQYEMCQGQHMQGFINFAWNEMASISYARAQDEEWGETGFLPGSAAHAHTNTVPPFSTVPFPVPQFPHLCYVGM